MPAMDNQPCCGEMEILKGLHLSPIEVFHAWIAPLPSCAGTIPEELHGLGKLEKLKLYGNQLSGE